MTAPHPLAPPAPLSSHHVLNRFECGIPALDAWLHHRAGRNEAAGGTRTFVLGSNHTVVGYYSLAAGSVQHATVTGRVRRNMPDPIPIVLLARLAVDRAWQGRGLGADLLRDAILRSLGAGQTIGVRAILVHAISAEAKAFYGKHGFRPSPADPLTLLITLSEVSRMLGA